MVTGYTTDLINVIDVDSHYSPPPGFWEAHAPAKFKERVPRIGWASVEPSGEAFWFAHSYAVETPAATATSEGVVAVAEYESFLGVQFHPEKSGAAGARYLDRVLGEVREQSLSRA